MERLAGRVERKIFKLNIKYIVLILTDYTQIF